MLFLSKTWLWQHSKAPVLSPWPFRWTTAEFRTAFTTSDLVVSGHVMNSGEYPWAINVLRTSVVSSRIALEHLLWLCDTFVEVFLHEGLTTRTVEERLNSIRLVEPLSDNKLLAIMKPSCWDWIVSLSGLHNMLNVAQHCRCLVSGATGAIDYTPTPHEWNKN